MATTDVARSRDRPSQPAGAPRRKRETRRARRAHRFAGGIAWIVLVGVLLAGIVAVNVLVLQLNMQFDGLSRERAQLKARQRGLRSQLSSASANVRIEEAATSKLGLAGRGPAHDDLRAARRPSERTAREPPDPPAARRLRRCSFVVALAPGGVDPGRPARRFSSDGHHAASRDDRGARRAAARSTTAPASRSQSASRRRPCTRTRATSPTPNAQPCRGQDARADADDLYPSLKDQSKGFVYVARKADPIKAERSASAGSPASASIPRSCAPTRRATSPRTCSASRAPTTMASTGSSARSTRRSPGSPASRRSSRTRSGARSTSSPREAEQPGKQRQPHDRPPDPGERRADSRAHGEAVRRARRGRDRDGSAHGRDPGDGELPDASTRTSSRPRPRRPAQPRRHRCVRAGLDVQDRDDRRRARGQRRLADDHLHPRADDPGRRPRHPRGPHARHRGDERQADPLRVVERRHDHGRAEKLGPGELASWIDRFGFGKPTGIDYPGESQGSCSRSRTGRARRSAPCRSARASPSRRSRWCPRTRRSGTAASASRPHLVEKVGDEARRTAKGTRVVSRHTADRMMSMFRDVVARGHRHRGGDPRLHGRREDRYRAEGRRTGAT